MTPPETIRRLAIAYDVVPLKRAHFLGPNETPFVIRGDALGLSQIADFARALAVETGDPVVAFEIFWPWELEEDQTWDAVLVDTRKIDANDPDDWWAETLPPYVEMNDEDRNRLGIPNA